MKTNKFIPLQENIIKLINWWSKKSLPGVCKEKNGHFNLELYLKYLKAIDTNK